MRQSGQRMNADQPMNQQSIDWPRWACQVHLATGDVVPLPLATPDATWWTDCSHEGLWTLAQESSCHPAVYITQHHCAEAGSCCHDCWHQERHQQHHLTNFKCSLDAAKRRFHRKANSIFSKVGRVASEEIVIQLMSSKCMPILLYGLEACALTEADNCKIIELCIKNIFMKLFKTNN